jgi:cob(I)alamin adenosyltransferase
MSRELWDLAREKINSGDYDMVILDELSYPLQFGWLTVDEVIEALRQRPEKLHVVITGRAVPEKLVEYADTVTEMKEIKHHFRQGVPARPGIEF